MFHKILVANRGEIALRIIQAAKQLNIKTLIVYSIADKESMPVLLADEAVCIGPAPSTKSYLNQESIIQTAMSFGCDAIHPGYGFLSENADFVEKCESHGITFIGPKADIIRKMGDKQSARKLMMANGVPVVPGTEDILKSVDEARKIALEIGYPVLIKASAGGGGRGMRIAYSEDELQDAYYSAYSEALSAFGNGDLYLEKYIINPRHIEVQILGDDFGNIIHLGERDCSIQRKNQKMIEEAPANSISAELRLKITDTAVSAARVAGYTNAGTVEFVLDRNDKYYFIEMNTRVQVEHPVTEMVTGVDIVRNQILIAEGEKLDITQSDISFAGYAIECRVNAENPDNEFAPSPGTIESLRFPTGEGVRIESAVCPGTIISPWYDSMICKIIVHAPSRDEAVRKMRLALQEFDVTGVKTNAQFLLDILNDNDYVIEDIDTSFVSEFTKKHLKKNI